MVRTAEPRRAAADQKTPSSSIDDREIWALCRVPKAQVVYLRYTLEAYEGLCVPTTLPGGEGWVRLLTSRDKRDELQSALDALTEEIGLVLVTWGEGCRDG